MSVDATVTLPNQPAIGSSALVPLGGNGYSSPLGAYVVRDMQVTGDASGGRLRAEIKMDQAYCSLVSYVSWEVDQPTPVAMIFRSRLETPNVTISDAIPLQTDEGQQAHFALLGEANTVGKTWRPTPVILPGDGANGFVDIAVVNLLNNVLRFDALIYVFDNKVRESENLGNLLWQRGSSN